MACLSTGRERDCTNSQISGGLKKIWAADSSTIDSVVTDVDGNITGIVMTSLTEYFYPIEFGQDTGQFTESLTNENCTTAVTQTLATIFRGRNQTDRNFIMDLAKCCCGLTFIHLENTGRYWMWGFEAQEEAFLVGNEGDSGAAKSDPNQEALTITAIATKKAVEYTGGEVGIPVAP
jgi:hypothetical protein